MKEWKRGGVTMHVSVEVLDNDELRVSVNGLAWRVCRYGDDYGLYPEESGASAMIDTFGSIESAVAESLAIYLRGE